MKTNLAKREFIQLSSMGALAAAMGMLTPSEAAARKHSPGANFEEVARSITAISYLAAFAFVIAGIYKFWQSKMNPTASPRHALELVSVVWDSIDATTASWLTASGYSPEFVSDAALEAARGDAADLLRFFEGLYDYLQLHPEP